MLYILAPILMTSSIIINDRIMKKTVNLSSVFTAIGIACVATLIVCLIIPGTFNQVNQEMTAPFVH